MRDIARFQREIDHVSSQLGSTDSFINRQVLVLTGVQGTGKTHLLCDFARRRLDAGAPTVLLMGQRFTETSEPWNQTLQQLGMHGTKIEEFVGAMEAAAQVSNSRALVIIDALNEGRGLDIWARATCLRSWLVWSHLLGSGRGCLYARPTTTSSSGKFGTMRSP